MLDLKYDIIQYKDSVAIHLWNTEGIKSFSNINTNIVITKKQVQQLTSIVQLENYPIAVAYMCLDDFRSQIEQKLVEATLYITDKELRSKMIEYAKAISKDNNLITTQEWAINFAKDIEEKMRFMLN